MEKIEKAIQKLGQCKMDKKLKDLLDEALLSVAEAKSKGKLDRNQHSYYMGVIKGEIDKWKIPRKTRTSASKKYE